MKRKIKKIISFIIYFIGIIALFDYSFKLHNNYVFKQNTLTQTSSYNDNQINFNRFNVTEKDIIKKNFITHEKTHAVLISTTSLSSTNNSIKSKFFVSINVPFVDGGHYTDLFLSVYYPEGFGILDPTPSLYYQVDDEEPIVTKVRYWCSNNDVLYFYFRPNVYDFIRKCSNGKNIVFTIVDYNRKTFHEKFSLDGFTEAYKFGLELLKNNS